MDSQFCYPTLKIQQQGSQLLIQDAGAIESAVGIDTLEVDLNTGKIQVKKHEYTLMGSCTHSLGILGVCQLQKGIALLSITEARKVADLGPTSAPVAVYELAGAQVLATPDAARSSSDNRRLLRLIKDAVDPSGSGRGLYFSHFYDVTLSAQRIADRDADPAAANAALDARADRRFWYNRALAAPLMEAGAYRFSPPVMLGFIRQLPGLNFSRPGRPGSATLTLIARRGVDRAGTRQWRRGADTQGNVANFVETEQLLNAANGDIASFVEIRGSIPLLWTQLPNIKYKPTTVIATAGQSSPAFDAHIKALAGAYGDVVAINLINHKGTEGKLEVAFRSEATRNAGLRYVAFDFHHECSKGRYSRLSLLWDRLSDDFDKHGFFLVKGGVVAKRQGGVMRTNCIDCLDRTNVVQGVLGRKALERMLVALDLMSPQSAAAGHGLPEAFPAVEREFKILWADHGDAVSTQYAGTGAMKSGFTRTGKRTFGGVIDDGVKAVTRYYLNNFQDGLKQDAIDLVTGAYTVTPSAPVPLKPQPSPLVPLIIGLVVMLYGAYQAGQLLMGDVAAAAAPLLALQTAAGSSSAAVGANEAAVAAAAAAAAAGGAGKASMVKAALVHALVPLVFGLSLVYFVVTNGKYLVNQPQLCPQMAVTVKVDKGKGGAKE